MIGHRYKFYNTKFSTKPTAAAPRIDELWHYVREAIMMNVGWRIVDTKRGKEYTQEEACAILKIELEPSK